MKLVIEIEDVMYALVMSQEPKEKEYWLYHVKHGKPLDSVFDKIRAEIEMYEADCRLQGGTDECEQCNSNVFGSIYRIIDRYKGDKK